MNFIFIIFLSLFSISEIQKTPMTHIAPGTLLWMPIGNEELIKNKALIFRDKTENSDIYCSIFIKSHFDVDFVKKVKFANYRIKQVTINNHLSAHYLREQINYMDLENKDALAPTLGFECIYDSKHPIKNKHIYLEDVQKFLGPDFFKKLELQHSPPKSIVDIMPLYQKATLLTDLEFAGKLSNSPAGGMSDFKNPFFYKGQVSYTAPEHDLKKEGSCSARYNPRDFASYSITLTKNTIFRVRNVTAFYSYSEDFNPINYVALDLDFNNDTVDLICLNTLVLSHLIGIFNFVL